MPIDLRAKRRHLLTAAGAVAGLSLSPAWLRQARAQNSGGTLTVALSTNPITCDPINMSSHDTQIISQTIWENLVEFDINGILKPQLAKALPTISDDKLTYAFELRDDVYFQNGQKLTAEDVKYSFEYMLDPAHKASRGSLFNRLSHVEVDSPTKLRVILKEPYAPWTTFLTKFMGIWPKGSRELVGDDGFRLNPVGLGTGPGIFEEWKPNDYVSLKKNPNYWQKGLPHWDRLVVKVVPEDATRIAYLVSGNADIIGAPPPREFARLKSRPKLKAESVATDGGWCFMLQNNAKPPFDDINFRLAVAHAVDRKTIAEKIYYGLVEASPVPSAEAYLLDTNDCAVFLQAELAKIGIKVVLKKAAFAVVNPQVFRGDYQASIGNFMSPGEPTYMITVSSTPNQFLSKATNFDSPKVAELLKVAFAEEDRGKLKTVYADLQRELAAQSPLTWFGFFASANVWRDRVKGFKPSKGLTINVRDVSVE